jgi:hypothetical protein
MLKNPNDYNSSWNWCVDHSIYHFDNTRIDVPGEWFTLLGHFEGDWAEEVKLAQGKPITWATRKFYSETDDTVSPMLTQEENDLRTTGAPVDLALTDAVFDISALPTLTKMSEYFGIEDGKIRMHYQQPGQMFNLHIDKLQERCPDDSERVIRMSVMLADWEPGQFYSYGTCTYSNWRAGAVHIFDWENVPHATANASRSMRPVLQITGLKTDKTRRLLAAADCATIYRL